VSASPPVIETDGLSKRYGLRRAVDGLSLAVAPGSVFGFLGPNGAALLVEAEPLPLLAAVAERMGLATAPAGPRSMSVQAGPELAPRLISALVHAGASVFQVTPQRRTLEERFLELTEG